MRVIHVSPTAFGDDGCFGGGERYPVELAKALAALDGVDCELVTFGRRADSYDLGAARVRVLPTRAHLRHHPAHPIAAGLFAAIRDADVIHVHHLHSAPSRMCALAGAVRRTPVAVTDHGLAGSDWFGVLPRLFDRFLTVSRYSSDVLRAPPARTTVVYGGADVDRFTPTDGQGEPAREGVLFVGRLTPHKGVDRVIEALPGGARLVVAGTGGHDREPPERDYPAHLHRLAAGKRVEFLGAVADSDLPRLYRRAAVVVVPSVHRTCYGRDIAVSELLGLSTLEAMASGTPVVASRVGGLTEVVDDGVTGHLVEPGDVEALRDRLQLLLGNPAHARRLGVAARARVAQTFTWKACAERCHAAYHEMVS